MAGEEKKPEGTGSKPAETQKPLEGQKTVEGAKKTEVNPSAEARTEVSAMKEKLEADKKKKEERRDLIKQNAATLRISEAWVGKKADNTTAEFAKSTINSKVEEKFKDYEDMLKQYGLGDQTNVEVMKTVAKELVFEHFAKNGTNPIATEAYFTGPMKQKMLGLFNGLDKLYKSKKYPFTNPLDLLTSFSDFTNFKFINSGILNKENLKQILLQQKNVLDNQLKSFEEYHNLGVEIQKISGEKLNAEKGKEATLDIGKMFAEGQLTLNPNPKLEIIGTQDTSTPTTDGTFSYSLLTAGGYPEALKKVIGEKLPENINPDLKEKIIKWQIDEARKITIDPTTEIIRLTEKGTWEKVKIEESSVAQKAAAEQQAQAAVAESPTAEKNEDNPMDFKTGIPFIDKILDLFKGYFTKILTGSAGVLAAKVGLSKALEFSGLNEEETKSASEMKDVLLKMGINQDTLSILLANGDETKKILKNAKEKKLNWNEYIAKYLDSKELEFLKKKQEIPADKISALFLSEKKA